MTSHVGQREGGVWRRPRDVCWHCPRPSTPPQTQPPPLAVGRQAYEGRLHEKSGTAEDVSVLDEAQTSLGRWVPAEGPWLGWGCCAVEAGQCVQLGAGHVTDKSHTCFEHCPTLSCLGLSPPAFPGCKHPGRMTKDPRSADQEYVEAARDTAAPGRER